MKINISTVMPVNYFLPKLFIFISFISYLLVFYYLWYGKSWMYLSVWYVLQSHSMNLLVLPVIAFFWKFCRNSTTSSSTVKFSVWRIFSKCKKSIVIEGRGWSLLLILKYSSDRNNLIDPLPKRSESVNVG